jgi:hypothetical protein
VGGVEWLTGFLQYIIQICTIKKSKTAETKWLLVSWK